MNKTIRNLIETEKLILKDAQPSDRASIETLCGLWHDKAFLEGHPFSETYVDDALQHRDLPPIENAHPRAHKFKIAVLKNTGETIGFFELYHGYSHEKMLWIGMFLIHPDYQKLGYGAEILKALEDEAKQLEYTHMGLGVYLKNWKGLRFWQRNGFNTIRGVYGDKEYSENTFALLGLEKDLK